jgi:hypothetical protein
LVRGRLGTLLTEEAVQPTEQQIRDALFSGDKARRYHAAVHVQSARPELFGLALEVLRESRPCGGYDFLHLAAARMVRDEAMLDAYLELLPLVRETWVNEDQHLDDPVTAIIRSIPTDLFIARHEQLQEFCNDQLARRYRRQRAEWLQRDPADCLAALDAFGREHADFRGHMPKGGEELEYAAESAARDVELSREWLDARLERLSVLPDETPQGDLYWLSHLAFDLAGHAGLRQAAPLMLDCLDMDDDLLTESAHHALARLMDADLLRVMDERFPDASRWTRHSFASIVDDRPPPQAAEVLGRWLDASGGGAELSAIAASAINLLDSDLLPAVERVVISADWDMMYSNLGESLLAAYAIFGGTPEHPDRIDRAIKRAQHRYDKVLGHFRAPASPPPINPQPVEPPHAPAPNRVRAGPNEPCPCGSGRKFKKCCMNKVPAVR